jgi:hypothetical protein
VTSANRVSAQPPTQRAVVDTATAVCDHFA